MKTIALRFADYFAPPEGTIAAHSALIAIKGYAWYGKLGAPLSSDTVKMVMENCPAKILLIHSGTPHRYWAYIDSITHSCPGEGEYPNYYANHCDKIKTWFRVVRFEKAPPQHNEQIYSDVFRYFTVLCIQVQYESLFQN